MVADALRRAHLHDGVPWSSMAVLVRSVIRPGATAAPGARRRRGALGRSRVTNCRWRPSPACARCSRCCAARCVRRPSTRRPRSNCSPGRSAAPTRWACAGCVGRCARPRRTRASDGPPQPLASVLRDPRELTLIRGPPRRTQPARVASCWRSPGETADDGNAHDVLWAVWDASGLARRVAGGERRRRLPRCRGRPRPGRGLRAVRRRRHGSPTAAARLGPAVPGQHVRPGDPGRHPRRARAATGRGPDPDRAPGQGPGVGRRRGGRGPGRHLAGPADALVAARHGRAHGRGGRRAGAGRRHRRHGRGPGGQAARRGAAAVLRRGHPRPRVTWWSPRPASDDSQDRPSRFLAELAGDDIDIEDVAGASATAGCRCPR